MLLLGNTRAWDSVGSIGITVKWGLGLCFASVRTDLQRNPIKSEDIMWEDAPLSLGLDE